MRNILVKRMINVVCLKWGQRYGPEYVNRLFAAVQRHTQAIPKDSLRFLCFTDDCHGIRPEVITHDLPCAGDLDIWWNKLWLFSADMPLDHGEQIFYIDLDTLITSDISDMVSRVYDRLVVLRDFYQGIARSAGDMGSGLMAWRHGDLVRVWQEFARDPGKHIQDLAPLGDQKWTELQTQGQRDYWQDLWPDRVVSFKVHCDQGLPAQASIVCYHGRPSIPESISQGWDHHTAFRRWRTEPAPWVLDHWRDHA